MTRRSLFRARLLAGCALAVLAGAPAAAQETGRSLQDGVEVRVSREADAAPAVASQAVDETALRAYAARRDYAAADVEIRRLKMLHPGWEPPADLFEAAGNGPTVDERQLWAALERGDTQAVRDEIAALSQINPGWRPPQELLDLLATAEARAAVETADDPEALKAAQARLEETAGGCTAVDVSWSSAEKLFKAGDAGAAYDIYAELLNTCDDVDLRLSTLQKALANRDDDRIASLFAIEEPRPRDGEAVERWAQIQRDWKGEGGGRPPTASDRLGQALAALETDAPDPAVVADIQQRAIALKHGAAASVLGWHFYDREQYQDAELWFTRAMDWRPRPDAAEGLAFTLQELGRSDDARRLAEQWADRAPALQDVLKGPSEAARALAAGDPARALTLVRAEAGDAVAADPGARVVEGWALQELERPAEAAVAFRAALDHPDADTQARTDAAQGLVLALTAQHLTAEAVQVAQQHGVAGDAARQLQLSQLEQAIGAAYGAKDYRRTLALISQMRQVDSTSADMMLLEGWTLVHLHRYDDASRVFKALATSYRAPEAQEGLEVIRSRRFR